MKCFGISSVGFICVLLCLVVSCKKRDAAAVYPLNGIYGASAPALSAERAIPSFRLARSSVRPVVVPEKTEAWELSSHIASYRYIHLETTPSSLLGSITKLCVADSLLFVFDRANRLVLRFSDTGAFLGSVGTLGKGPGEYVNISDISLDRYRKEICLLDLDGGKLNFYDYDGRFLRSQPLYYFYNHIEFVPGGQLHSTAFSHNVAFPSIDMHRLLLSGQDQAPRFKGFSYPAQLRASFHWEVPSPLQELDGRVYYHHILSDTIWEVCDSVCRARYVLEFPGRHNPFTAASLQNLTDREYLSLNKRVCYFTGLYLQTRDHLCFYLRDRDGRIYPLLYHKSTGHMRYGAFSQGKSDAGLLSHLLSGYFDFTYEGRSFVKVIQPFETLRLLKMMKKYQRPLRLSADDRRFVSRLHEEDNPVLLVVDLKPF